MKTNNIFFNGIMKTKLSAIEKIVVNIISRDGWDFHHHLANGISCGIIVL